MEYHTGGEVKRARPGPSAQHVLKLLERSGIPSALRLFIDIAIGTGCHVCMCI